MLSYLSHFLIFLFGLCLGSFLNVVICRLDNKESILFGRSHCPKCGKVLAWYDLIPLLSFFLLKRKCRYCGKKISWQYPLVEIITGLSFLLIFNFQFSIFKTVYYFIAVSFLIIISVYDLKHYIIPDEIIYPAIILALIFNLVINHYSILLSKSFWLLTALSLSGAVFFLLLVLFSKGKWMGMGDVKLAAFLGLFLGWPSILLALSLSFFVGAAVGLALIFFKKKKMSSQIPFGPFLSAGALIALFWGSQILSWYWGLFL